MEDETTALAPKGKREQKAIAREEQIREKGKRWENMNATNIAEQELNEEFGKHGKGFDHDDDEDANDPGALVNVIQAILSVFRPPPKPPLPWKTNRRDEINNELDKAMHGILGILMPFKKFWYWRLSNKKLKYVGDYDKSTKRLRD